jgi:hypothetical protein
VSRVLKVSLPPRSIGDITIGDSPVPPRQPVNRLSHAKFWGGVTKVTLTDACRCGGSR